MQLETFVYWRLSFVFDVLNLDRTFLTDMLGSCGNDTCVDTFMLAVGHVCKPLGKDKAINCVVQQLN